MGTGQRHDRQGQHMLGMEIETFLWSDRALSRAMWPAYPITPLEPKGLKEGHRGPGKGSAAGLEVLTPSPFHILSQSTQKAMGICHPAQDPRDPLG